MPKKFNTNHFQLQDNVIVELQVLPQTTINKLQVLPQKITIIKLQVHHKRLHHQTTSSTTKHEYLSQTIKLDCRDSKFFTLARLFIVASLPSFVVIFLPSCGVAPLPSFFVAHLQLDYVILLHGIASLAPEKMLN
ncbi:hypothetical protein R6Q59_020050 [Mikania micrantha]